MKKGILIILSGPSGVGKGTVRQVLMQDESLNLVFSISMTTRGIRPNEVNGRDYFFVSKEEFEKNVADNNLLEYAEFCGNMYGTPRNFVEKVLESGKNVLLEIETHGALQVMKNWQDDNLTTVFLLPPSIEELEARIRKRKTEDNEIIQKRLAKAKLEIPLQKMYNFIITNQTPEQAAEEIKKIIKDKTQ